jgi:hypothetical protein
MHSAASRLFALLLLAGANASALAHDYKTGDLVIDHPWARPTPSTAKNGAAYFTIRNDGRQSDILLGAKTPLADVVELHNTLNEQGVMKMRKVADGVPIPAGATVTFESGGLHMMLVGLKQPLTDGGRYPVTLMFKNAGEVPIEIEVERKPAGSSPADQTKHHH